jgi:elongator complex protein 3
LNGNKNSIKEVEKILTSEPNFDLPKEDTNLEKEKRLNEQAKHRIVGLTLETRPDLINLEEVIWMRKLGCTRVELGVQSIYDDILKKNRRGHLVKQTVQATKLLKDAGFKINYHLMPNLPGSDPKKDLQMFNTIFTDKKFQPDMIKIYPCVLTRDSELLKLYENGEYTPYSDKILIDLLIEIKKIVPTYLRIMRLGRDIPANNIIAGNKISNIRQVLHAKMQKQNIKCNCIRCREIRSASYQESGIRKQRFDYNASDGKEIFLSYEDVKKDKLLAFLRLRIPSKQITLPVLKNSALIREVHSYGQMLPVSKNKKESAQHKGYGKKLVALAENIIKDEFGLNMIAVISGVGVRKYYQKLGYQLKNEYMIKQL